MECTLPFIAAIIGLLGVFGGVLRRSKEQLSTKFLAVSAVTLTMISELLQNIWFALYMWAFYMPETPFLVVFMMTLAQGIASAVTAIFNNIVFFVAVAPRTIRVLKEWVVSNRAKET